MKEPKETLLQEQQSIARLSDAQTPRRVLVACHDHVLNGGLLRFERVAKVISNWGHELAFVCMSSEPKSFRKVDLPVLSLEQASRKAWDAVMLPGAGFPEEMMERLPVFQEKSFGVRIQHILSGQGKRDRFMQANKAFRPHVVVFNNLHWPAGTFDDFQADRFHVLLGGVDPQKFHPAMQRTHPLNKGKWIIGGRANYTKNPELLISTIRMLPENFVLRMFGPDSNDSLALKHSDLVSSGRLLLTGPLEEDDMVAFYQSIDCLAMTETIAGWANIVAEAMASGVPVVCTPHGTGAFAFQEKTALIINPDDACGLAKSIQRLADDKTLCHQMTESARSLIERFSWEKYSRELLDLINLD